MILLPFFLIFAYAQIPLYPDDQFNTVLSELKSIISDLPFKTTLINSFTIKTTTQQVSTKVSATQTISALPTKNTPIASLPYPNSLSLQTPTRTDAYYTQTYLTIPPISGTAKPTDYMSLSSMTYTNAIIPTTTTVATEVAASMIITPSTAKPSTTTSTTITTPVSTAPSLADAINTSFKIKDDNYRTIADFFMYIALIVSLIGMVPCIRQILDVGFTRYSLISIAFQILVVLSQLLLLVYRYIPYSEIGLVITAICLANLLSLWHELYVTDLLRILSFLKYFVNKITLLRAIIVAFHLCTAGSLYIVAMMLSDIPSIGVISWFGIGYALWISALLFFNNICYILVTYSLYERTTTINWYNERHIKESTSQFFKSTLIMALIFFLDITFSVSFIWGLIISSINIDEVSPAAIDLFRIAFYCRPISYLVVSIFFNQVIDMGFGSNELALRDDTK
ncbi:hypothetical protein BC833DRAFT_621266 [Globomyces pollinis-pini]|nr:hypothetical protein BC833DRAFT_621266 [Globomyces pollinis-pini]